MRESYRGRQQVSAVGITRRQIGAGLGLAAGTVAMAWLAPSALSQGPQAGDARAEAEATVAQYCVGCHNATLKTAGLVLDPSELGSVGEHAEVWEKVLHQLRGGTMPPPGLPRPAQPVYDRISDFLIDALEENAAANPNPGDLSPVHRLTRTEYQNAVRDLLDLPALPKEMDYATLLPADNSSSGFDNLADTLFVSPATMERYVNAAVKISRIAIGDLEMNTLVNIHTTPLREPQEARNRDLPFGTQGGMAIDTYFPLDGEYDISVDVGQMLREPHQMEITIDGHREQLIDLQAGAGAFGRSAIGTQEFRLAVPAGPRKVGVTFLERSQALSESPLRPPGRWRGELPSVVSVTITGPFNPTGPGNTPTREKIFVCRPMSVVQQESCAREILSNLARRAYRRPVTDSDLEPLLAFYRAGQAEEHFDNGIQRALERLLVSPQFLFRIEREPDTAAGPVYPISDLELASRLSFFLWSSIPDEELLRVAEDGRLRDPVVLEQQVRRMLADDRAASLVGNFAAQWLFLRDVETKEPDLYLFRDFDEGLQEAFVRETELFVSSVLRGERSVLDLITADYSYLNERLAKHYQIPNVTGSHFRRVTLPAESHRGGLLGQGSILLMTSYTTRTSAVLRGKYVLENLLASPPPPPPPNVPSLDTAGSASGETLSMREAMVRHRAQPACASCHARMDPIGFAMENFDAVGRWRADDNGKPIDVVSSLPDGTEVDGLDGVKRLLLAKPERFVEAVTEKLMMYALGRNVQYYDRPAIRKIARDAAGEDHTFASLVLGVVESPSFQTRLTRPDPAYARRTGPIE